MQEAAGHSEMQEYPSPFFCTGVQEGVFILKKKSTIIAVIVLAAIIVIAAACWLLLKPGTVEGDKTITVVINHLNGEKKTFTINTDAEYLRGALEEEEGLVEGDESTYGLYILTMDGETADESKQEWWGYTKSGEYVEYSVDQCPIADGEHYEFTLNVGW